MKGPSRSFAPGSLATALILALSLLSAGCEEPLTADELAAKDRGECQAQATRETGYDPVFAEAPPRTISTTSRRGGKVVGEGDIVKGAAKGAVLGVVGGAIMGNAGGGAGAGAAIGGLMGGAKRHKETNEMVTSTHTNPEYVEFQKIKEAFLAKLDACLDEREKARAKK